MSSESGDEPAFTDCLASGTESTSGTFGGRKRQTSIREMVRNTTGSKAKKQAARRPRSPDDPARAPGGAGGFGAVPAPAPVPQPVQLDVSTLAAIKQLIEQGNEKLMKSLEMKLEGLERRIGIIEGECMDKDETICQLTDQLQQQTKVNEELQQRLEDIDLNGRLSSLILTCEDFARHNRNDDIERKVVNVLNERIPDLNMTTADVHAAHKLQNDNKVICKFVKRQVRDRVYDARFNLARFHGENRRPDSRRLAPLYIAESLTPSNRVLYEELLRARRPENGGLIASVFSRRGLVWCRAEKGGANIRVPDGSALRRILGGRRFPPQARPARRPVSGAASSRPSLVGPAGGARVAAHSAARVPPSPAAVGVVVANPERTDSRGLTVPHALHGAAVPAPSAESGASDVVGADGPRAAAARLAERGTPPETSAAGRLASSCAADPVATRTRAASVCGSGRGDSG